MSIARGLRKKGRSRSAGIQYMFEASPPAQKLAVAVDISQLVPSQLLKMRLKISNPARQRLAECSAHCMRPTTKHRSHPAPVDKARTEASPHPRDTLLSDRMPHDVEG